MGGSSRSKERTGREGGWLGGKEDENIQFVLIFLCSFTFTFLVLSVPVFYIITGLTTGRAGPETAATTTHFINTLVPSLSKADRAAHKNTKTFILSWLEIHSSRTTSLKTNNYDFRKSLQLFTFRHKQEEHRAVEEGDHDQAGEVGTMMIKLGRWRDEDAVSKVQLQEVSPAVQCQ